MICRCLEGIFSRYFFFLKDFSRQFSGAYALFKYKFAVHMFGCFIACVFVLFFRYSLPKWFLSKHFFLKVFLRQFPGEYPLCGVHLAAQKFGRFIDLFCTIFLPFSPKTALVNSETFFGDSILGFFLLESRLFGIHFFAISGFSIFVSGRPLFFNRRVLRFCCSRTFSHSTYWCILDSCLGPLGTMQVFFAIVAREKEVL